MIRILVSRCLFGGEPVRYDGRDKAEKDPRFLKWKEEGRLVPVCPEVEGGLSVPRPPAQIRDGRAVTEAGKDVTEAYVKGAEAALEKALSEGAAFAVMKQKSPSCGSRYIYDGTFTGRLKEGKGITAELLTRAGIKVFGEDELKDAAEYLDSMEKTVNNGEKQGD
ncbi:MAG: DUF523 domain-containing protein [Bacillota bacterium]|nr:DUF523 domain-containing protein [Bacillota bacterium]